MLPLTLTALLLACVQDPPPADTPADSQPHVDLPGHDECLPPGERMSDEVCLAVLEADGRYPTTSEDKSGVPTTADDARLADDDYNWMTDEVRRCTCVCCHSTVYGGPGTYLWDIDFEPVWIDSMSGWSIGVFGGWTEEAAQTLPTDDLERLRRVLDAERQRRRDG